ncbi:winged helix-turn-helix transcriptional regulator [Zunongwangia profunda]|uniref:Transcriptional regulator n=1 Tax=Zunongwangia profunda (strain DSM 18752 / CCTCC AB 206139 / SM-A87) TaxID=655815 RepID=D5B9F8_ZUNPS|nr:winged helix-turn-helix transcriptional regulator [Zunongwangia profunda]ADF54271.1 transcriptional regulator [Zunongwangia profunda SM-A87]
MRKNRKNAYVRTKKLEENRVLTRKIYAEVPPCVEYELTHIGYQLKPVINELETGLKNIKK